jgi:DNA-binding transcriptional ArsR family regulator
MPVADLDAIAAMFAALGHPARLAILRELLRAHPGGLVVGEIQARVAMPGSTLSHHLDALRHAGIIDSTREGQRIRYCARVPGLREVVQFLSTECCAENRVLPLVTGARRGGLVTTELTRVVDPGASG